MGGLRRVRGSRLGCIGVMMRYSCDTPRMARRSGELLFGGEGVDMAGVP